jgi:hypothetical protein
MPQAMFVRVLGAHRVPCFDLDDDEIDGEVAAGRTLGRAPPA